jgi:transcriptional regulator with XRE-family HTH domain
MTQEETLFDRELLALWMKHAKVRQKDLAAQLGLKPQTLGSYTNNTCQASNPPIRTLKKMADNLPWGQLKPVWKLRDEDYRLLALLRGTACNRAMRDILEEKGAL